MAQTYIQFTGRLKSTSQEGIIAEAQQVAVSTTDKTDIKTYVDNKIKTVQSNVDSLAGTVYRTKGSTTFDDLTKLTSAQVGDVWNISEQFTLSGRTYPAYTNVVCVKGFSSAITPSDTNWDALGGITIDTSHFANIYTYDYSVLPTKNNVGSTDSGLTNTQLKGIIGIASHLANGDLVMISGGNASLTGTYREIINKYSAKYIPSLNANKISLELNFDFYNKSYSISCINGTWSIFIGSSESARLAAVEEQLKLV